MLQRAIQLPGSETSHIDSKTPKEIYIGKKVRSNKPLPTTLMKQEKLERTIVLYIRYGAVTGLHYG